MSRAAAVTGIVLVVLGLAIFGWKAVVYELPVLPTDPEGIWRVELLASVRGNGGRGSIRAPLPSTAAGQEVYDERSAADRLVFTIRTEDGERIALWRGPLSGVHDIAYGFRVRLEPVEMEIPADPPPVPRDLAKRYGRATGEFPSDAPEVAATLETLSLPPAKDVAGRIRAIYAMVAHEIATSGGGSDDALIALANHAGSERGKTALLVTLLRSAGIPARPVVGLELRPGSSPHELTWVEAWAGDWIPLSPEGAFFASRPAELVALREGSFGSVEATGAEAISYRYEALREHLRPEEVAALLVPPNRVFRELSLYRLPVSTQLALRLLLTIPLGALVMAFFRNVVGVPTFGTFMPVLVAFALRNMPLLFGLLMVASMIGLGVLGRLVLERLRLLLVPRLSILLCVVVLGVAGFALIGRRVESSAFFAGVLFPIVILTMLIERFSISIAEEGMRNALVRAAYTLLVTVAIYPVLREPTLEYLMFSFPELTFCVMGVLVWIGGYTGYRLMDLLRFRSFAEPEVPVTRAGA